ncbi:MAG: hypothetical protein ABEJ55_07825 [Halanaeroarchaeum sp.]
MNAKRVIAALLVVLVVASGAVSAAGFTLDPSAEQYPETYYQEDDLTVLTHDRAEMGFLEWENDTGDIVPLDAHVNGTDQGEVVSYLASEVEDPEFAEYPRQDAEENNSASALDASEWSVGGTNSTKISVTDATGSTAPSVQAIQIATDGTMASGDDAYASYSNQSITDDPQKRYVQVIADVNTLDAGGAELQIRDGTGDYATAQLNTTQDATAMDVIANTTANGVIFQAQVGKLPLVSGGDGTLDAIEELRFVATDTDVDMTLTAVNVEKKSMWDFGTTMVLDTSTDDTDDYTTNTINQNPDGDRMQLTGLDTLGSWSSDSVIHNLVYLDVRYRMQDKPEATSIEFRSADNYPSYPTILDVSYTREIPTGYDLSHGDIDLVTEQSFLSERYTQLRYAEAIGDTDPADVSSWTDLSSSLGDTNTTITVDSTIQPGATNSVQFETKLVEDQKDALEYSAAGGFWGGSADQPWYMNIWNWAAGGVAGLVGAIGVKLRGVGG